MSSSAAKKKKDEAVKKAGADYARKQIAQIFAKSKVHDNCHKYPKFEKSELTLGKALGEGGFGIVYEVRAFSTEKPKPTSHDNDFHHDDNQGEQKREFIAEHCIRDGGDARYAVKFLKPDILKDPAQFIMAIKDMAIESRFLSSIKHTNIVKMRALSHVDAYNEGFFIVMDRLYDTLEKRMEQWKKKRSSSKGLRGKLTDKKGTKAAALMEERVVCAYDLSGALAYLHGRQIVYRDIKPENIGFDVRGDIKIFDFGLSKELKPDLSNGDGTYKLTGTTGSTRYMAPEISRNEPYNLSCDVYSFAILFWQMLALEMPFASYLPRQVREQVHNGAQKRPKIDETWSPRIKDLLEKCWSATPSERYEFKDVEERLQREATSLRHGDDRGLNHMRRRSTYVFRSGKGAMMTTQDVSGSDFDNSASTRNSSRRNKKGMAA